MSVKTPEYDPESDYNYVHNHPQAAVLYGECPSCDNTEYTVMDDEPLMSNPPQYPFYLVCSNCGHRSKRFIIRGTNPNSIKKVVNPGELSHSKNDRLLLEDIIRHSVPDGVFADVGYHGLSEYLSVSLRLESSDDDYPFCNVSVSTTIHRCYLDVPHQYMYTDFDIDSLVKLINAGKIIMNAIINHWNT